MNSNVDKITGLSNSLNIFFHLTDFCNFSCEYCVLGRNFSGLSVGKEKIDDFLGFLDKILSAKLYESLKIVISGGEPTIDKNFFYLLENILKLDNKDIGIQVTTNGFVLGKKEEIIKNLKKYDTTRLFFNISYHYYEYEDKKDDFLRSLNLLKKLGYKYEINFLIPDKRELGQFVDTFNYLKEKNGFNEDNYRYTLINSLDGKISKNYSKEKLDFYDDENKKTINKNEEIKFLYDSGKEIKMSTEDIFENNLNRFYGYKCHYINKNNVNLNINSDGSFNFGICNTLNKIKYYSYGEIYDLLLNGDKYIHCGEEECMGKWELFLDKTYYKYDDKILEILKKIIKTIFPREYRLKTLNFSKGNYIQYHLEKSGVYVFFCIETIKPKINYCYKTSKLGYQSYSRDKNYKHVDNFEESSKYLKLLVLYNKVFEKILLISEK